MRGTLRYFLFLLGACSPVWLPPAQRPATPPGDLYICVDLPEATLAEAEAAVAQWALSLSGWKTVHVQIGRDVLCNIQVQETTRQHPDISRALAWVNGVGGNQIYMRRGWYEQDVEGILLHEIGHALGAQHLEGTLMARTWEKGAYRCPDRETVAQVAAWHRVNLDLLTWCS